jgi:16S rRNA (guanine527-N7)-methyltransferase
MDLTEQNRIFQNTLKELGSDFGINLSNELISRLNTYFEILNRWNPRLHLVAPIPPREFATRHILESLMLIEHLPSAAAVIDVGSGGGLPMIPCLVVRPDLRASLIESAQKKAVFLREALKDTGTLKQASVIGKRFEEIPPPPGRFVTSRALDRFQELLPELIAWSPRPSTLLFFGGENLAEKFTEQGIAYSSIPIPYSDRRFLLKANLA